MSVVILDGSTVRGFVADEPAFARSVDARFAALDANGDGVLSRAELRRALESFRLLDGAGFGSSEPAPLPGEVAALYDAVFEQFDADGSGAVDRAEFRDEMRRIMLAVADGLGSQPLQVAVDDEGGSFLLEAAEHEAAEIAARVEADRKAVAEAATAETAVAGPKRYHYYYVAVGAPPHVYGMSVYVTTSSQQAGGGAGANKR